MFDAFKNLGNLGELMTKARQMQDQMKQMQEELADLILIRLEGLLGSG